MRKILDFFIKPGPLMKYLYYSCIVTVIDTVITWLLYRPVGMNIFWANSIGVIAGFIIHYLLSSKSVFSADYGVWGFVIYLGTFILGLLLADGLIWLGENILFTGFEDNISFILSKGISIVIPFFFQYYLRKLLFILLKKQQSRSKKQG